MHGAPATIHLDRLWIRDVTITTGLVDTSSTPLLLLRLLAEGGIDTKGLVTHRFGLHEMQDAYDVVSNLQETEALKAVLFVADAELAAGLGTQGPLLDQVVTFAGNGCSRPRLGWWYRRSREPPMLVPTARDAPPPNASEERPADDRPRLPAGREVCGRARRGCGSGHELAAGPAGRCRRDSYATPCPPSGYAGSTSAVADGHAPTVTAAS